MSLDPDRLREVIARYEAMQPPSIAISLKDYVAQVLNVHPNTAQRWLRQMGYYEHEEQP